VFRVGFRFFSQGLGAGLILTLACAAFASPGPWDSTVLVDRAESLYQVDARARSRLLAWGRLVDGQRDAPTQERLEQVNRFFNEQLRFEDDRWIWGTPDYWATPIEALVQGAADCEDYAIAKYVTLKQLGIDPSQLRLVYVKAKSLGQSHMVLAWYPDPNAEPLILDNLIDDILPASRRADLVPIYSFNTLGLWLPGGNTERSVGSAQNLPRWQGVQNRMRNEGLLLPGVHHDGG
jgi:predicted transglutaminase-like cysteine proteinase